MITDAVNSQDDKTINLLAQHCYNSQEAKNILRQKGYGVTGEDIVQTVELV